MVPEGWREEKLGNLFEFKNGANTEAANYGSGIKFVNVMDVLENSSLTYEKIRGSVNVTDKKVDLYMLQMGDVLFNRTSETFDEIALSSVYLDSKPAIFGGFVIRGRPTSNRLNPKFCIYCFSSSGVRKELIRRGQGAIRANIGQADMRHVPLLVPSLPEQKKIASILSTWDKAIETVEALIENSKAQKKALMQQLLTGKRRLSEFGGDWVDSVLTKHCKICTGDRDLQNKVDGGQYPFFVRSQNIESIDNYAFDGEAILIPGDGRVGEIFHYIVGKFNYHQRVYKLSDFVGIDGVFIYYYLQKFFKREVKRHSVKATVDSLRMPVFKDMRIKTPSLAEQKIISAVLRSCDISTQTYQSQLESFQKEKRSLMQQLLTGKRRVKINVETA